MIVCEERDCWHWCSFSLHVFGSSVNLLAEWSLESSFGGKKSNVLAHMSAQHEQRIPLESKWCEDLVLLLHILCVDSLWERVKAGSDNLWASRTLFHSDTTRALAFTYILCVSGWSWRRKYKWLRRSSRNFLKELILLPPSSLSSLTPFFPHLFHSFSFFSLSPLMDKTGTHDENH